MGLGPVVLDPVIPRLLPAPVRARSRGVSAALDRTVTQDGIDNNARRGRRFQLEDAVYPTPSAFSAKVNTVMQIALREAGFVASFAGYRATLKHFMNSLDDEHAGVAFAIGQTRLFWPGFVIRRMGGRYVTAASTTTDIPDGRDVSACDGDPIDQLVERTASYEGGHPGLESTKASAALSTLIDQANPFLKRPTTCTIGGKSVRLIGFVDELKRFPGVKQIGTETLVDSRSGTPMTRPLPSGNASIYVPTMTRDGRTRDDNVLQRPDIAFQGGIADTAGVQRWVLNEVLSPAFETSEKGGQQNSSEQSSSVCPHSKPGPRWR